MSLSFVGSWCTYLKRRIAIGHVPVAIQNRTLSINASTEFQLSPILIYPILTDVPTIPSTKTAKTEWMHPRSPKKSWYYRINRAKNLLQQENNSCEKKSWIREQLQSRVTVNRMKSLFILKPIITHDDGPLSNWEFSWDLCLLNEVLVNYLQKPARRMLSTHCF